MNQCVVAFTGISGVGKTTFLKKLAQSLDFQLVSAGSLIVASRNDTNASRDAIRHDNMKDNQINLIKGFELTRDRSAALIIIDAHVVVDDGISLSQISPDVFKRLGIMAMIHLEADPARIEKNRLKDSSRIRPEYNVEILRLHQEVSRTNAELISRILGIDFHSVTHEGIDELVIHCLSLQSN